MATGQPATPKLELEFTAGAWTDVTVDSAAGPVQIHVGRSSPFSQPQPATLTCALDNQLGKYSPFRQVLTDGTTTHPHWPNIIPRKRIRYSYIAGVQQMRYLGYISSWVPTLQNGVLPVMTIQAVDRMDPLSRLGMQPPLMTEYLADAPAAFWPLTDGANSAQALDASGAGQPALLVQAPLQTALSFGDNGPGFGDGSGVKFAPSAASNGQFLQTIVPGLSLGAFTFELWVNAGVGVPAWVTGSATETVFRVARQRDLAFDGSVVIAATGKPTVKLGSTQVTGSKSIVDGGWHHIAVTRASSGGNCTFYLDGVSQGATVGSPSVTDMDYVALGVAAGATARLQGNIGYVAIYNATLSSTRIQAHYTAGNGYYGDTTDTRAKRFLGIAGLTSSDWSIDTGQTTVNHYPQGGKDVVSACQDMATTEGGGAAFYVLPNGQTRFANRRFRDNRTPAITLDAAQDLIGDGWQASLDALTLTNSVTADRSAESGSLTSQTATATTSVTQYGLSAAGITTYTTADADALNLAQWMVSANSQPGFRAPQVTVNLVTAENNLYAALATVQIGSRLRLTNLAAKAGPVTQLDLFIEGWTETYDGGSYIVVFDVSPVDYRWKWDTSRWAPDAGQAQLNAAVTNSAATLAIKTLSGPTWTTSPGSYPLTIKIGEEQITLTSAPGGSTSPQTFTGVTRGVNNTVAAAQAINSVVTLSPPDGWAL